MVLRSFSMKSAQSERHRPASVKGSTAATTVASIVSSMETRFDESRQSCSNATNTFHSVSEGLASRTASGAWFKVGKDIPGADLPELEQLEIMLLALEERDR